MDRPRPAPVRGVPISDDDAFELAGILARDGGMADLVGRLSRASEDEVGGLVATSQDEARAVLFAVQEMLARREHSPRLLELRASLVEMVERQMASSLRAARDLAKFSSEVVVEALGLVDCAGARPEVRP